MRSFEFEWREKHASFLTGMNSTLTQRTDPAFARILKYALTILLCGFLLFLWWERTRFVHLSIALDGYSAIDWIYERLLPQNFSRNFPNGTGNYDRSSFMLLYLWAQKIAGISPEAFLPVAIGLEIALLSTVIIWLSKLVTPKAPQAVRVLLVILCVASSARNINFGSFGQPFIQGLYYNAADFFRVSAIILLLTDRPILAAAALGCAFTVHPTLAVTAGLFMAATQIPLGMKAFTRRNLIAAVTLAAIVGTWTLAHFEARTLTGAGMIDRDWYDFTQMFSYHWYPIRLGFFTYSYYRVLLPFLSLTLLTAFTLSSRPLRRIDYQLLAGASAMLLCVVAGVLFSELRVSTLLVKLALQRANDLIVLVFLCYAVDLLWNEISEGRTYRKVVAIVLLCSPFFSNPPFPIIPALLLVLPPLLRIDRSVTINRPRLLGVLVIAFFALAITYKRAGLALPWLDERHTGYSLRWVALGMAVLGLVLPRLKKLPEKPLLRFATVLLVVLLGFLWLKKMRPSAETLALARSYQDTQLWARNHTAPSALFMQDPTIYYGWRDYSRRSSFGNLREWLYAGWCYNSDRTTFDEGLKRTKEFNAPIDDYRKIDTSLSGYYKLSEDVQRSFYSSGDEWMLNLAKRYGIDYFVLQKDKIVRQSKLPVVFENTHYLVLTSGVGSK
jgi:hypothetical protein